MKQKEHFLTLLIAMTSLTAAGAGADKAAPGPVAPPANGQLQIQGGGQIQFQPPANAPVQIQGVQGGAQFRIQVGAGNVRVVGNAVVAAADEKPRLSQPPAILFPIFPFHLLPNLTFEKEAKPGYLGVQLEIAPGENGEEVDPKDKEEAKKNRGVGILEVMEDSPAAKAGLKEGDRVLAVEGKAVKDSTELRASIQAAKADNTVKLTVQREGKEIEVKARLGAFPENNAVIQMAAQNIGPAAVPGVVVFNRTVSSVQRSSTAATNGSSKAAPSDMDAVSLRDGNRFLGKIQHIDPAKGLVLHREAGPDLELSEEAIASLTFADRDKTAPPPSKVVLQLRDGSCFIGDALTMERGKIQLTLPGGQRLELPRDQALSATLSAGQGPQIYEGPMSLAGWSAARTGQGNWDYKDGFLRCINNGPIARNFERMPDPLDLSFDVLYPPQLHHFGIALFSTAVNQTVAGTLTLQFSPQQISGNHFDGRRYNQYNINLGPADDVGGEKPTSSRYRLLADRVNGRVIVYVNGVKRADWNLSKVKPEDIGKCGANFSISPNVFTSNAAFQVGRIQILPWDGKEPADGKDAARARTDQVIPAHGPAMNGTIERITEREILFGDKGHSVPRDETVHIRFETPPTPPAELPPAVALVRLKNGSEFAVTKLTGSGDSMSLTTRFGSQITLPLSALRDLEFLPRPGQPDASATGPDVLTLTDGTQLKGTLLTPIADGNLRWKIAASKAPLVFPETEIAGVLFPPSKGTQKTSTLGGSSAVRLADGDWLPGDIVSLDDSRLVLKNDLAPELVFPVSSLRSVYLSPEVTASVADGATGPDLWNKGWNPNRGAISRQQSETASKLEEPWAYHDGTYTLKSASRIGSAALARKWAAYPGAYALNFDVENPGRTASFNLQLFNAKEERTFTVYSFGGRVNVYFNPSSTRLARFAGGAKRFQVDEQTKSDGKNLRMSLVMDRPAKTFRLFMDGKEIGKIPFKDAEANEALDVGGMSLTPMASGLAGGRQSRIANFWFAPWPGPPVSAEQQTPELEEPGSEKRKDSAILPNIYLANGDEFAGKIEGINAELLTVNSEAGLLELPRERVAWLNFPRSPATPSSQFPRLRFHDRGTLSIKDLQIDGERVKCQTLLGQALEFPLSLVKEVVYRSVVQK